MKKYFLFACVAAALVSCSSDEFLGNEQGLTQNETGAIVFQAGNLKATRADQTGEPAANTLGRQFYVYGVKNLGTTYQDVFGNYSVWYTGNGSTSSSEGWEYVGTAASFTAQTGVPRQTTLPKGEQTIKYWDYSSEDYWFNALSVANVTTSGSEKEDYVFTPLAAADANYPTAKVGQIAYATINHVQEDNTIFYADAVQRVKNGNGYSENLANGQTHANGEPVHFTFKRLQSKVRIGFYETVPGYAVNDVKFYPAADLAANTEVGFGATSAADVTLVTAATTGSDSKLALGFMPASGQTYTITYDYAHNGKATLTNSSTSLVYGSSKGFGQLNYTVARDLDNNSTDEYYMGESAANATWAVSTPTNSTTVAAASPYTGSTGSNYWMVLPNESQSASFKIKVDYTLTSLDGSKENIYVKGATAVVPAQYCNWNGNTAYTYLFKISDNSNGTTGEPGVDPAGLFPITFDAVVAEVLDATQETITTVADPSITTYAEGSDVTTNDEYEATESIVLNVEGATATAWEFFVNATAITEQEAKYLDETASPALSWTNITATDGVYKFTPSTAAGKYVIVRMTYAEEFTPVNEADVATSDYTNATLTTAVTAGTKGDGTTKYYHKKHAYKVIKIKA